MSATNGFKPPPSYLVEECAIYRNSLPTMIREHGPLSAEERAYLAKHGVTYDPEKGQVEWTPREGEPRDLNAEREALVQAVYLFLEDPEPMTEQELQEGMRTAVTFEQMAAELGLDIPPWLQEAKQ